MENNDEKLIRHLANRGMSPHNIAISFKGEYSIGRIKQIIDGKESTPRPTSAAEKKQRAPREQKSNPPAIPERKALPSGIGVRNRKIRRDYHKGMTVMDLSLEHNLPQPTICRILKGKTATELKEERNEVIRAKFTDGVSADDLAEENDLTRTSIYRICADLRKQTSKKKNTEDSHAATIQNAIEATQRLSALMSGFVEVMSEVYEILSQE